MILDAQHRFTDSFGAEYEREISKSKALALLGGRSLPDMGRQKLIAMAKCDTIEPVSWRPRLNLTNVCGSILLRSFNTPCAKWKETFGIEGLDETSAELMAHRDSHQIEGLEFSDMDRSEPMVF